MRHIQYTNMFLIKVILISQMMIGMTYSIVIDNGRITFDEYNCTLYVNSAEQMVSGRQAIGLHFGIVRYICPTSSGISVSKLSCAKCGVYCAQNELIDGCGNGTFPFAFGFLIGIFASLIPIFLARGYMSRKVLSILHWIKFKKQLSKDKKVERETERVEKVLNTRMVANYSECATLPRHLQDKIEGRRANQHCKKAQALALIALSASAPLSHACDKTLFVSSNGMICQQDKCIDNTMISLSLQVGNHICFNSHNGDKTEIRVTGSYYRMRYTHEYDTMDYYVNIVSHWECKQLMSDCWNGGCLPDEVHQRYSKTNNSLVRHGCMVGSLGCDTWCISQTSCSWYEAKVVPKEPSYGVVKFQSKIWEVKIEVTRKGFTVKHFLNSNNPLLNVDDIGERNRSIPMVINSILTEEYHIPEYLLLYGENAYTIDANSKNNPMLGRFGDIQKNTIGETTFPTGDLAFSLRACKVYGEVKESQMSRFKRTIGNYNPTKYTQVSGNAIIETRQQIGATYNFMIQVDDFKSLEHNPSNCDYEIISTFACTECEQKPHVVLHPIKINHKGLIRVVSNCSLDTSVIPCGPEPVIVSFNGLPKYCSLSLNSPNETINVSFNYVYKGTLNAMETRLVHSATEDFKSLATNTSFLTGMVSSLTTIASISVVATFMIQLFKLYQLGKAERDLSKA